MKFNLSGFKIYSHNPLEALLLYREVFKSKIYEFDTNKKIPLILDCGSHIGVSIMYFKKNYPQSKIIAFEPDPNTFKILQRNVRDNKFQKIRLINKALSNKEGKIEFFRSRGIMSWAWGSSGEKDKFLNKNFYSEIDVKSTKLSAYITQEIDFLKLDIEGMESKVLFEIESKLSMVKNIFVEFHRVNNNINTSSEIIDLLRNNGFKLEITRGNIFNSWIDFLYKNKEPYRLNIIGKRN